MLLVSFQSHNVTKMVSNTLYQLPLHVPLFLCLSLLRATCAVAIAPMTSMPSSEAYLPRKVLQTFGIIGPLNHQEDEPVQGSMDAQQSGVGWAACASQCRCSAVRGAVDQCIAVCGSTRAVWAGVYGEPI